ncbi:MAG: hypothetical protein GY858_10335 [Candidatus Omnitrophica bacterium]|nr:hypothetical protein [Candidatus Omnitrophota bacterium]
MKTTRVILCLLFAGALVLAMSPFSFAAKASKHNIDGVKCMRAGQYEAAVELFQKALTKDKNNKVIKKNLYHAFVGVASASAKKKSWERAISFAEKAYKMDSSDKILKQNLSTFYSNYGYQLLDNNMPSAAFLKFRKAVKYNKENFASYIGMGSVTYNKGDIKQTVKHWQKAVEINPNLTDLKQRLLKLKKESELEGNFQEKRRGYFEVKYEGRKKENLAKNVLTILKEAYSNIGYAFKYYPKQTIQVIIYTDEQFQNMTGEPGWIGGTFDGIIRVTSSDIKHKGTRLKNILYHEYVHAVLFKKVGASIPTWLNEGLAQHYESGKSKIDKNAVNSFKNYYKSGKMLSFDHLNKAFIDHNNQEQLKLAYLQAKVLVIYLHQRYYSNRVRYILEKIGQGKDFNAALSDICHIDIAKFQKDWIRWLDRF